MYIVYILCHKLETETWLISISAPRLTTDNDNQEFPLLHRAKHIIRAGSQCQSWITCKVSNVHPADLISVHPIYLSIVKLRSRSRSQVRSRSGPRSGPKGQRTKGQRPGPGLTLNLVCHPPTTKLFTGDNDSKPLLYDL